MTNKDFQLFQSVIGYAQDIPEMIRDEISIQGREIEHPLDEDVISTLNKMLSAIRYDDNYILFSQTDETKKIWKLIIEKSIKCLRFFDKREPFLKNSSKRPVAYGVKELSDYFEKYTEFESMLYGGCKYYRNHVIQVFRIWLLGLDCLLRDSGLYLSKINIQNNININSLEKISIWSMISLTHDLGYPFEKAQGIIEKNKEMMKSSTSNASISLDLPFNGIQNNMNDFVVRFMSSKMQKLHNNCSYCVTEESEDKPYVARLQPKYYFKFQKSLEGYNHGILSATILYKLLIYFLESDFNINEDYRFNEEEARQFYIRREILRTIASHTCHDVYHLDMMNFSFLLIMVDDAQEWGRKSISELHVKNSTNYEFDSIYPYFGDPATNEFGTYLDGDKEKSINKFVTKENFHFPKDEIENLKGILSGLWKQHYGYLEIFRDGQDTAKRNFIFVKTCKITLNESPSIIFSIEFVIYNNQNPTFYITVSSTNASAIHNTYALSFLEPIFKNGIVKKISDERTMVKYEVTTDRE